MSVSRALLDTVFVQALLNPRDGHHRRALSLYPRIRNTELWVTESVLVEIGDGMSAYDRSAAARFVRRCYGESETVVVSVDSSRIHRGLDLYELHRDKRWSLTDCISFVVMREFGIDAAVTADRHFVQAGFRALMLEED